jgi:hypothetical protein
VWTGVFATNKEAKVRLLRCMDGGSHIDRSGCERTNFWWDCEMVPSDGAVHRVPERYFGKPDARLISRLAPPKDLDPDIPF